MNQPDMIEVKITEKMIATARESQALIMGTGLQATPNYTNLQIQDRFFHGYVGELAFVEHLQSQGCWCAHRIVTNGRSQIPEISARMAGVEVLLEVKTSSKWCYQMLMAPEAQEVDGAFVFGVKLDLDRRVAAIMGGVSVEDFMSFPVSIFPPNTIKTRFMQYALLTIRPEQISMMFDAATAKKRACWCLYCSPIVKPTYSEAHRHECECRMVAALPKERMEKYLAGNPRAEALVADQRVSVAFLNRGVSAVSADPFTGSLFD